MLCLSNLEIIRFKNSSDSKIGLDLQLRPILAVLGIFSSNYFQIGQHVVILHYKLVIYTHFQSILFRYTIRNFEKFV